ncbi:transcriptional regulator [Actinomadura sp. KC216]|uniref:transcriptional regulator n=1 Tax=Actinomadura sp. KC216 TaxID=2530370 RepID=UPI00104E59BD|nr:transcriptional regulator [Actinomadura sp. KC216]TDB85671.1 transcriptional regulator [Actinomadura sp. KC216]
MAYWRTRPNIIPQPAIQETLDAALANAQQSVKEQFFLLLASDESGDGQARPQVGGGGANYRSDETDKDVLASHNDWLSARRNLNQNRAKLTQIVSRIYPEEIRLGATGILMPESWRLRAPVDLTSVELKWREIAPPLSVTGQHAETARLRPLVAPNRQYTRYHRAMRDLDRPRLFENRLCYRLLSVDAGASDSDKRLTLDMTLGNMCYFDMIDVGEALAHETGLVGCPQGDVVPNRITWESLPFRRMVRDPFALSRYPLMLSVSTLTVRQSDAGTTFLLLRRNPAKVAIAGGMLSVFPTGVFQPASVAPAPDSPDFDLWRNVMREYSEEFLGNPEHDGDGPPIDYENEEPFRSLNQALRAGKIRVLCLGVGVDALNYVGDVFTVAVFDADVFDRVFDGMVKQNDEGDVVSGDDRQAFNFDGPTIERLLSTEPIAPSGAACLSLAWQHRDAIVNNRP